MNRPADPLISVVITCFNIRDYVADALRSVLAQSYPRMEIIIVDDGSTDDSRNVLAEFFSDERVRYVAKENGGPSSARNRGITLAHGEFIAFLDGDDLWESEKLSRQMVALYDNQAAGMVFCDFSTFDSTGSMAVRKNASLFLHLQSVKYEYLISRSNFIYPSTVIVRRTAFDRCGVFDETLRGPEDYDMWLRIAREFDVIGLQESLVNIRQHSSNLSKNIAGMISNERAAIDKQRCFLSKRAYNRRIAKLFLLNADRSIHANDKLQALRLLFQGIRRYPALYVEVSVVLAKLLLGGRAVERIRRSLNHTPFGRSLFEVIYRRY